MVSGFESQKRLAKIQAKIHQVTFTSDSGSRSSRLHLGCYLSSLPSLAPTKALPQEASQPPALANYSVAPAPASFRARHQRLAAAPVREIWAATVQGRIARRLRDRIEKICRQRLAGRACAGGGGGRRRLRGLLGRLLLLRRWRRRR